MNKINIRISLMIKKKKNINQLLKKNQKDHNHNKKINVKLIKHKNKQILFVVLLNQ